MTALLWLRYALAVDRERRHERQVERMIETGMTNGQLRALLEAIRIINDKATDKNDLDAQLVRIQNSLDKNGAAHPSTESDA